MNPKYLEYMRSDAWREKRLKILQRDRFICQACLIRRAEEVHHKTYEHFGNEPEFDLISVCKPCHDHIAETIRARRKTKDAQ